MGIKNAGGKVTPDGRVNGGLNLSRAIGDHAYKQNKSLPLMEQMISPVPDVRTLEVNPSTDPWMILACDGIWNFMSSQEVVDYIQERIEDCPDNKLSGICEELFEHCLAPDTLGDGTGCDNMTAVIVRFKPTLADRKDTSHDVVDKEDKEVVSTGEEGASSRSGGDEGAASSTRSRGDEESGETPPHKRQKLEEDACGGSSSSSS